MQNWVDDATNKLSAVVQAGKAAEAAAAKANAAADSLDLTGLRTQVTQLQEALGGLSFAVNSDDGGLDITYTYTETEG